MVSSALWNSHRSLIPFYASRSALFVYTLCSASCLLAMCDVVN